MKRIALTLTTLLILAGSSPAQTQAQVPAPAQAPKYPDYPSETPTDFKTAADSFDLRIQVNILQQAFINASGPQARSET